MEKTMFHINSAFLGRTKDFRGAFFVFVVFPYLYFLWKGAWFTIKGYLCHYDRFP